MDQQCECGCLIRSQSLCASKSSWGKKRKKCQINHLFGKKLSPSRKSSARFAISTIFSLKSFFTPLSFDPIPNWNISCAINGSYQSVLLAIFITLDLMRCMLFLWIESTEILRHYFCSNWWGSSNWNQGSLATLKSISKNVNLIHWIIIISFRIIDSICYKSYISMRMFRSLNLLG